MAKGLFSHPLILTSPYASGDRVKVAQKALKDKGYYVGAIDGQFGPKSVEATKRAKYWLGYSNKSISGAFGQHLYDLLIGKRRPNLAMKVRIKHREEKKKKNILTGGLYKKALTLATHYIGVKENPVDSNLQEFGAWYGINGVPWCAIFQSFILTHCGRPFHYSYVPFVVADARAGKNGMRVITYSEIAAAHKAGHPVLACYDWNKDGTADHIGMVDSIIDSATFYAVEGNTGDENLSNGGEVMRAKRYLSDVQVFVLVYN